MKKLPLSRYLFVLSLSVFFGQGLAAEETSQAAAWSDTLERISSAVVSIEIDSTRSFDTELSQSAQATGFVVDAERGLILTNRHVVTPGPARAQALFLNQEEVELIPIYRDPVHDFGFFRYDPTKLRYIDPEELPLVPDGAQLGRDIRVIGNDAGEQLSILSGTIARLRRRAPAYGPGKYNDFNTFYIQAASSTSGGSSGAPVIDVNGNVVGLNAGASSMAASSFFLPLDRIKRALELIQAGEPVARGTLETIFVHRPYDELRRLGLRTETEAAVRKSFPDQTGMLVVSEVLRGSAADRLLRVGDILVAVNEVMVTDFVPFEEIIDAHVDGSVQILVERNGQSLQQSVPVTDLHTITPDEFIQFGDSVVHNLSYQVARHFYRSIEGIYVASAGYVLGASAIPRSSIITEFDGQPVKNLDDFEAVLDGLADRQKAAVRFFTLEDPQVSKLRLVRMDRRWFPAVRCKRNDTTGAWPCRQLSPGPAQPAPEEPVAAIPFEHDDRQVRRIAPSLVQVHFDMPYTVSGIADRHYYGTGLVVDAERGFVVVDKNTVPAAIGDVRISFAGSVEITGRVEYVHPLHNLAVLSYDPALLGDTPVRSAKFSKALPDSGDAVLVVGLRGDNTLVYQSSTVESIQPAQFPLSRTLRFREANLEAIRLVNGPGSTDGVLIDDRSHVVALWSSFAFQGGGDVSQVNLGIPADLVEELLQLVGNGRVLHSIEAELSPMPLSAARNYGLPEEWAQRMGSSDPERRQILSVRRLVAGTPAAQLLLPGDLLLSIDGVPVTRFRQVERAVQKERVSVEIWRDKKLLQLEIDTVALDGSDVQRAIMWAGALLQEPYRAMAAQRNIEPYGVYVAFYGFGSPASRSGLLAGRRIVEIDGQPIMNLDSLIKAVRDNKDGDAVRVKAVAWNGADEVITLKLDNQYWPTYEIFLDQGGWRTRALGQNSLLQ
ncbi:MAG: trypsin-like peptidase domain-containing protein [Gammaproteobacteria bacterium]